ncbi:MAG: four-carbon acid sugar kinase family protein, partial [Gammaproteobacteria bacterium]
MPRTRTTSNEAGKTAIQVIDRLVSLLDALGAPGAAVCPAFPANRRTVYMGHLFVGDRLLSESGMERHPLNPMT